ncbi:hypothetical protein SDC9_178395 [bioreactor metagenome]|uniref:Uncharacterized protein n=1 Tax=bioreactor metagenome TaxID=1076179 RepID=A0A645H3N1_9ZZZZ
MTTLARPAYSVLNAVTISPKTAALESVPTQMQGKFRVTSDAGLNPSSTTGSAGASVAAASTGASVAAGSAAGAAQAKAVTARASARISARIFFIRSYPPRSFFFINAILGI